MKKTIACLLTGLLLLALFSNCAIAASTSKDSAFNTLWEKPTEANLIAYATIALGEPETAIGEIAMLSSDETGIILVFDKDLGTILFIKSRTYGNMFWSYNKDNAVDAIQAFSVAAQLYDKAIYVNTVSGQGSISKGSEVTLGTTMGFTVDIAESFNKMK